MEIKYKELIGFEGNITELSNKLQALDCEDICYFGNLSELMDDGNIVVATDECGDNHIQLYFDILFTAGDDEAIEATIVKITNVENF